MPILQVEPEVGLEIVATSVAGALRASAALGVAGVAARAVVERVVAGRGRGGGEKGQPREHGCPLPVWRQPLGSTNDGCEASDAARRRLRGRGALRRRGSIAPLRPLFTPPRR